MSINQNHDENFPLFFWGILGKSIVHFKSYFVNYLTLAVLSYLPFAIIAGFSSIYVLEFIEFIHGILLDIIVFLTLPTVFMNNRVYPAATLQLFFRQFFASAVLISFIQLVNLVFLTQLFLVLGLLGLILALVPFVYLLFPGFFLVIENSQKTISIRNNLLNSVKLVRGRFLVVFWNYLTVTILVFLPFFFLSVWYMSNNPEVIEIMESIRQSTENQVIFGEKLPELIEVFKQPLFTWSRASVHVLFRPLKSLFLSFLFLGIIYQLNPSAVRNFLGISEPEAPTGFEHSDQQSQIDDADSDNNNVH